MKNNLETLYVMYRIEKIRKTKMIKYFFAILFLLVAAIANIDGPTLLSFLFLVVTASSFYKNAVLASGSKQSSQEMVEIYNSLSPDELADTQKTAEKIRLEIDKAENTGKKDYKQLNKLYSKLLIVNFVTIFRLEKEAESQK